MANQPKGNQVFNDKYLGKFPELVAKWDELIDQHPDDAEKISQQSTQDANRHLAGGLGPIAAVHAVLAKTEALAANGDISTEAADAAKNMLVELKQSIRKQREQEAKDAAEKKGNVKVTLSGGKQQVQWRLAEEPADPVVHSLDEYYAGIHAKYRADLKLVFDYLEQVKWAGQPWQDFMVRVQAGITKRELATIVDRHLADARANH